MNCPKCGKNISNSDKQCPHCHAVLDSANAASQSISQNNPATSQTMMVVSFANKAKALKWLIFSPLALVVILTMYAIIDFVFKSMTAAGQNITMGENIIKVVTGFVGLFSIVLIIVGIGRAIYLLTRKEAIDISNYDQRSGKGSASVIPDEIRGWNWGSAGLGLFWGIYFGVWWVLLSFVPYVSYLMPFILGYKGSEWSWQSRPWQSVEQFKTAQKKWQTLGIVFFVLTLLNILNDLGKLMGGK